MPWHRVVLLGLAVLAFCGSLATSSNLFPLGSINHDEPMYVFEAHMLRQGHVTLPTRDAEFFRPWAAGVRDGRVVLKYTPAWPAVIAASEVVFGSGRVALALVAAALVIVVYLLGVEVFDSPRIGLIAAALFALSPMVVVLSGTFLPYTFQLLVEALFAYFVLSGLRLQSAPRLVLAGAAISIAVFARPFDAVVVGLPFLAFVVVGSREDWRTMARRLGLLLAGAAPLLALTLWLNAQTMGNPLRSPFTVTGRYDTIGFGRRGVFPSTTFHYGPKQALHSLTNLRVLPGWTFGGVLVVALAAIGVVLSVRSGRRLGAVAALIAVVFTVTVGYLFFWSPVAIMYQWPGASALGPFYHLPVLLPIVLFAGVALDRAIDRIPLPAIVGVGVAMVALTLALVPSRLATDRRVTGDYRVAHRVLSRVGPADAVVFLEENRDQGFESATPFVQNAPDLRGHVVYASDLKGRNLAFLHTLASRVPYRFDYEAANNRDIFHTRPTLTRLQVRKGALISERLRLQNPGPWPCVVAIAQTRAATRTVVLDTRSSKGRSYDVDWALFAPGGTHPAVGTRSPFAVRLPDTGPTGGQISLGVGFSADCRLADVDRYEQRFSFAADSGSMSAEVLGPGAGWHELRFAHRRSTWIRQDLDGIVNDRP